VDLLVGTGWPSGCANTACAPPGTISCC